MTVTTLVRGSEGVPPLQYLRARVHAYTLPPTLLPSPFYSVIPSPELWIPWN